ncbi:MAG: oligoribonuclease [Gammaproteobacteria bacterium]|nr:oligoribonuclease [Gammaproteobacteria bacterium]
MTKSPDNLIWIDLEMTGLVPEEDKVIEIATIVTDSNLEILAEGPVIAIHQPDDVLNAMDEWNTNTHGNSGLIERVRNSQVSEQQAEQETIEFLSQYVDANVSPICGNSICQDRRFLAIHMPRLEDYFHYRNLDVSTVKELGKRWNPQMMSGLKKNGAHLALDDIRESIEELRFYRNHFLKIV